MPRGLDQKCDRAVVTNAHVFSKSLPWRACTPDRRDRWRVGERKIATEVSQVMRRLRDRFFHELNTWIQIFYPQMTSLVMRPLWLCVFVSNTAQYEQICRAQGLVLSTQRPQHTHCRGFTANYLQAGPINPQSRSSSASAQKDSVSVLCGCAEAH